MAWRCRLVRPTKQVEVYLRRYAHLPQDADERLRCPRTGGYHNAFSEEPVSLLTTDDVVDVGDLPHVANLDKRWPVHCPCGFEFRRTDPRQVWTDRVWVDEDDGRTFVLRTAPAGIMWHASWRAIIGTGPDGLALMVRLPDGLDWHIDGPADGEPMTIPALRNGWTRHGTPPRITVTPSIHTPTYHGTLTEGVLSDDIEGRTYA